PSFHLAVDMQKFSSSTVTAQEMRLVWSWIPERFSLFPPLLLFSTSEDGCSLQRFYTCCEGYEPTVLLIKTTEGEVCGAFLSSDWAERKKSGATSGFFGTGECFVFTGGSLPAPRSSGWGYRFKSGQARPAPLAQPRGLLPEPQGDPRARTLPGVAARGRSAPGRPSLPPSLVRGHRSRGWTSPERRAEPALAPAGGGGGQALSLDASLLRGHTEHCETFDNPPLCQENFQVQLLEVWGFQSA
ncbi:TBC1 domain family member 24-like, partial [Onychostruthus taczanowskii]|uniref:TBC1 domain family member 24-like n=1 Tax=Onychostruthus taczanowskii TaxID=356909 RepID=UPI001B80074C